MQFLKMQDLPTASSLQDQSSSSGFRDRDVSPDSVIFTADSNFSLFSSTSASVDRCSFASDIHDQEDSVVSGISQNLAGHEFRERSASGGGPSADPDPNKFTVRNKNSNYLSSQIEKAKVQEVAEQSEAETEDEISIQGSARNSFSQALKECQDRRLRSEGVVVKKPDRRRPASLDLNNSVVNGVISSSSPRLAVMKKTCGLARKTSTFPSPGTPIYRHTSVGVQKGWSSERVPLHNNVNKRLVNTALLPYNNGKALPSKWEDAERWIFSPVSGGDGLGRHSVQQPQRRPKSKSGPLGPPGIAYHSLYSPAMPMLDGGNGENHMENSPFSAGVMVADALSIRCGGYAAGANFPASLEPCMARSISVHGCSELICQSSMPAHQDEMLEGVERSGSDISRVVSRRDMATQMSPEGSPHSSSRQGSSSFSPSTPILPIVELQSVHSSKPEVRDVQVDERVTVTRWSKKHRVRVPGRGSGNADDWKRKAVEIRSSGWDVSETAKTIAKIKREEAKISAWENLQKAKAEAAIRKLEMKLEKKRSSSMDKIMNKLRSAQKKAQEMRSSMAVNQAHHQVARTNEKAISFRRTRQISSFSGCFTCHAF